MTGPNPWQDEQPDALEAALDRYARAFPKAGLPFLRGGPDWRRSGWRWRCWTAPWQRAGRCGQRAQPR